MSVIDQEAIFTANYEAELSKAIWDTVDDREGHHGAILSQEFLTALVRKIQALEAEVELYQKRSTFAEGIAKTLAEGLASSIRVRP